MGYYFTKNCLDRYIQRNETFWFASYGMPSKFNTWFVFFCGFSVYYGWNGPVRTKIKNGSRSFQQLKNIFIHIFFFYRRAFRWFDWEILYKSIPWFVWEFFFQILGRIHSKLDLLPLFQVNDCYSKQENVNIHWSRRIWLMFQKTKSKKKGMHILYTLYLNKLLVSAFHFSEKKKFLLSFFIQHNKYTTKRKRKS